MSNKRLLSRLHPDDRREQILQVAVEHFSSQGYDGAAMSRIAADAGVTRALVYHYFPGKAALLEAVLLREAEALIEATAPDPAVSPRENVTRALGAYLDHFAAASGELRTLYVRHPTTPAAVWRIAQANHDQQVARLFETLKLSPTPRMSCALSAWLAFVEESALQFVTTDVSREEITLMCVRCLEAATGSNLDEPAPAANSAPEPT